VPTDKVRIGILGAGAMGAEHTAAYGTIRVAEVVAYTAVILPGHGWWPTRVGPSRSRTRRR